MTTYHALSDALVFPWGVPAMSLSGVIKMCVCVCVCVCVREAERQRQRQREREREPRRAFVVYICCLCVFPFFKRRFIFSVPHVATI